MNSAGDALCQQSITDVHQLSTTYGINCPWTLVDLTYQMLYCILTLAHKTTAGKEFSPQKRLLTSESAPIRLLEVRILKFSAEEDQDGVRGLALPSETQGPVRSAGRDFRLCL